MTLKEKYRNLNNPHFLEEMIVAAVYNTMLLEGQEVSKEKLVDLYKQVEMENAIVLQKLLQRH